MKETLDTFKKLDQNLNYEYIINDKDDGHNSFQILEIKFILANISVDIRIPVVDIKIANIQIYINHDIDARAIDYDPEHIKNFKLNETSKAKDFYFNKILEIFEQLQE